MSYTSFAYRNLAVTGGETITASFTVTNTGDRDGADVPQLYLTDAGDKRMRLLGFERIELDLNPAVIVALVTLSIAPVGALFPQAMLPLVMPGHGAYAHGLFFASTLLPVILTPLAVEVIGVLFGSDVHVSPLTVAQVAVGSMLLPLGIGLALGRWRPAAGAH